MSVDWITGSLGRSNQAALATAPLDARIARLDWKVSGLPHIDGIAGSRLGLAPSIEERDDHKPYAAIDVCNWNASACAL